MSTKELPLGDLQTPSHRRRRSSRRLLLPLCAIAAALTILSSNFVFSSDRDTATRVHRVPINAQEILRQCSSLKATVGPPPNFLARDRSDRYEPGTNSTLIKNANIWTGARSGTETVVGDVLLENGVIKGIGYVSREQLEKKENLTIIEADGAWVTPGLVDLHSHLGLMSAPMMNGAFDVNSPNGPILPWLRSIDAFNTHDEALQLAIAGGVTTVQVLPGSGNAIGGQAFMIKLRKTKERSPTSMILEPPHWLNGSIPDPDQPLRWRHLKQACGENLRKYGTRMDAIWSFRQAYNEARKIVSLQDAYCEKAEAGLWGELSGDFPDSYKWEALIDVLRGRVRISNHCYEAVDLDDIVRLSNEFKFHIASVHHASEAWLVPDVLKRMFGGPPAVAIFAMNHRYKRESYRGSQFAPRVLAENGLSVVMKSDHPVINSRYLMYEAQQAFYYGLPQHLALSSVTAAPAQAAGLSHRIGALKEGADADIVLWDSHPLHLGSVPRQVWIDGIPQLGEPKSASEVLVGKPKQGQQFKLAPKVPSWDVERKEAVKFEGLPPLGAKKSTSGKVVLSNVREVWIRGERGVKERWSARPGQEGGTVVLINGAIACVGREGWCLTDSGVNTSSYTDGIEIDLRGGSVGPGLMTFGSPIGTEEISSEPSTGGGPLLNAYDKNTPNILKDTVGVVRAVDGLMFATRNALIAHRAGVTYATSSLGSTSLFGGPSTLLAGLSTTFRTGAAHSLEHNAVVKRATALHVALARASPLRASLPPVAVSTQIAAMRRLLLIGEDRKTETGDWFHKAAVGAIPFVVEVHSADIMATLIKLKEDVEEKRGSHMRLVFSGATEAHLIAKQIADAKIGVILSPVRPFPANWDEHRILAGPPITNQTSVMTLLDAGVTVALGVTEAWHAPHTRFEAAWAASDSGGRLDKTKAYELITTNLEKLMDVEGWIGDDGDLVIYDAGSVFSFSSKVIGVASPRKGVVDFF